MATEERTYVAWYMTTSISSWDVLTTIYPIGFSDDLLQILYYYCNDDRPWRNYGINRTLYVMGQDLNMGGRCCVTIHEEEGWANGFIASLVIDYLRHPVTFFHDDMHTVCTGATIYDYGRNETDLRRKLCESLSDSQIDDVMSSNSCLSSIISHRKQILTYGHFTRLHGIPAPRNKFALLGTHTIQCAQDAYIHGIINYICARHLTIFPVYRISQAFHDHVVDCVVSRSELNECDYYYAIAIGSLELARLLDKYECPRPVDPGRIARFWHHDHMIEYLNAGMDR